MFYSMYVLIPAAIVAVSWAPLLCDGRFTVYRYSHTEDKNCLQDNIISGNGIYDKVTMSCEVAAYSRLFFTKAGFVLGDYEEDRQCAFSDQPNELVVLQGFQKTCYLRRTSEKQVIAEIMDRNKCTAVKDKIREILDATGRTTTTGREAAENGDYEFIFADKIYHENSQCKIDIELRSSDFKETITVSCVSAKKLNLLYIPHGFIFGDYQTNTICVFAESADALVVIAGKYVEGQENAQPCYKKIYAAGLLAADIKMTDQDCVELKKKIRKYWDANDKEVIRINSRY